MPVYAFVDSIAESPTILLDLDDQSPLTVVEAPSTNPPTRRVSSSGSSARDGDTIAQAAYNDRQITIPLDFAPKSTADQQAETIQALGRLLDSPCWLMWQHESNSEPVFFRVKYGDMDVNDAIADETPDRGLVLQLIAEPFAYGLPVMGTATIANDPTAATNPMSYVFPEIQGDVATPLQVLLTGSTNYLFGGMLGVSSGPSAPTAPRVRLNPTSGAAAGWAMTSGVADSTAIGGITSRWVKSSGAATQAIHATISSVAPGDYRVLVRMRTDTPTTLTVSTDQASTTRTITGSGSLWAYQDFGVFRLPDPRRLGSLPGLVVAGSALAALDLTLGVAGSTAQIDVNSVHLIPAGLDDDVDSSLLLALNGTARPTALIDGLSQRLETGNAASMAVGGYPVATPGVLNVLTFVPQTEPASAANDNKVWSTGVTTLYYPRYLYVRPATT